MKSLDNYLCLICAKGNSKGLRKKNIKKIEGKTLLEIAFLKAKKNNFNFFCLSTEDNKIIKIAKKFGLPSFFTRSKNLTKPNVSKLDVWKDCLKRSEIYYKKKFDYILDIEVTNPLTTKKDLRKFLDYFMSHNRNGIDGCLCVIESQKNPYFTILRKTIGGLKIFSELKKKKIYSRQKAPITYDHIGAFYILKRDYLLKTKHLFDGNMIGYNIEYEKTFDIDNMNDFKLATIILKNNKIVKKN